MLSSREVFGWCAFWLAIFFIAGLVLWTPADAGWFVGCLNLSVISSCVAGLVLARVFELGRWPRLLPGFLLGSTFTLAPVIGVFVFVVWRA